MERGLIYARASRDPRATGTSVDKQLERGVDFARRNHIDVVAQVRDDNRSASRGSKERPGFTRVRSLLDAGEADLLILWEVSRSSRDLEEFMGLVNACADQGIEIVVSGTRYDPARVDDWLPLVLQGVMAEAEAKRIKKRNLDSVETNAKRGTPHGRLPYGYRRLYDPRTGVLIDQTPFVQVGLNGEPVRDGSGDLIPVLTDAAVPKALSPEARVLVRAADAVLQGNTLRSICSDLDRDGIPSPRKPRAATLADHPADVVKHWTPQTLRQLLLNPTIAGRRVHRGEDIGAAAWAAILDYGLWLRLRAVLTDPARLSAAPRGPQPRHLLSGVAVCGECGSRLKAATNLSRMAVAYVCRAEGCMKVTASGQAVDKVVEATMRAYFQRPEVRGRLTAGLRQRSEKAIAGPSIEEQIAAKERELDEVDRLRAAEELTLRAYARESARIEADLERLRQVEVPATTPASLRRLLTAPTLVAGWDAADLIDKRQVLKALFIVTVRRATRRGRIFDHTRVAVAPTALLAGKAGSHEIESVG